MPRPELIFLHSGSADGCNNAQHVPPVSSDLKNASKQWPVAQTDPPTAADVIEDVRGDAVAALRITLIANAFPKAEIDRLSAAVSFGFARGKVPPKDLSRKIRTDDGRAAEEAPCP